MFSAIRYEGFREKKIESSLNTCSIIAQNFVTWDLTNPNTLVKD